MKKTFGLKIFVFAAGLVILAAGGGWGLGAAGLTVKTPLTYPGKTLTAYLKTSGVIQPPEGQFLSSKIRWYPVPDGYRAFIPVPLEIEPGFYQLKAHWLLAGGEYEEKIIRVQIKGGTPQKVSFNVPTSKKKLLKQNVIQDDWRFIEAVLTDETKEQYWSSAFVYPLNDYYITLGFGVREIVNGQKRGCHRGLDMSTGMKEKSDILAINAGRVALAQFFDVFGGTVVIDHGQGIHSLYYHLSKIIVKPGQKVAAGQVLGKMGTTGISSGVHLHLGLSVHNVRVDPRQWLEGNI
jgi:murein DD-endopeptidase MepM/ murein hydrolase activator NlpD